MRTSVIVFSKATLLILQGCTVPTGLFVSFISRLHCVCRLSLNFTTPSNRN
jgi:hypothetical protein